MILLTSPEFRIVKTVRADDNGNFEITEGAAGRHTVRAGTTGFVTASYGQTRPGQFGQPIDVTAGRVIEPINVALPRRMSE